MKIYYKKRFCHTLDMATPNAFILYRKNGRFKWFKDSLDYILFLGDRLIEESSNESLLLSFGRPQSKDLHIQAPHHPTQIPLITNKFRPASCFHLCYSHKK
ncbi:unnamed protein product [Clavelina lepadiformis]|uniref:Uncharacterized protein n=1 Tax=Clavelina lepadiformis TaxID=159417 RepID=A0ABP0GPG2_CLALP